MNRAARKLTDGDLLAPDLYDVTFACDDPAGFFSVRHQESVRDEMLCDIDVFDNEVFGRSERLEAVRVIECAPIVLAPHH